MASNMYSDPNNTLQSNQGHTNIFTFNNTNTLSQQNNSTEIREMNPYMLQSADSSYHDTPPAWVRPSSDFQDTGSFHVDESNPFNQSLADTRNVFNMGAPVVEHGGPISIQGPNLPRGNGPISNPPFQENAAVELATDGPTTPLANGNQDGNIRGARQASATLSDNSVTSVQNPQSSQGAAALHVQQKTAFLKKIKAHIHALSKAKMDSEKDAAAQRTNNQKLRTDNQQMQMANQQMQMAHHQWKQHLMHIIQYQNEEIRRLKIDLATQTNQCNLYLQNGERTHYNMRNTPNGFPKNKDIIEARLIPAHTAPGPNFYGPAAQNSLMNPKSLDPVGATTIVRPAIVSNGNGPSVHQNGPPSTSAPHNPLVYVDPAYSDKGYLTPADTEGSQITNSSPTMPSLEATKPPAVTIDLTKEDELETPKPMTQIAADTTGTNKVPDSNDNKVPDSNDNKVPDSNDNKVPDSNEHSRDHYIENQTSQTLCGPKKEPPWMHQQRVHAKETALDQAFAEEKLKNKRIAEEKMRNKRKAKAEEGPSKKAKTQSAVKAAKPIQEKSVKTQRVPAKSKTSTNTKKQSAQPAAETSLLDKEREQREARDYGTTVDAETDATAEREAEQSPEWQDFRFELDAYLEAQPDAQDKKESQEFEAETEPGAKADLDARASHNKHYKSDACIDPALLALNGDVDGQYPAKEAEETVDRASSPVESLANGDDNLDPLFNDDDDVEDSMNLN